MHLDIVEPLPPSQGYTYLVTIIDRFTHWPEANPIPDGILQLPESLSVDVSSNLVVEGTYRMFRYYSAQNLGLPPYCNLQMALLSDFIPQFHSLGWFAPMVLLGIRTALKTGLGCSLAELVYGTTLRIPDEFFVADQITQINPVEFVSQLKAAMSNLKVVPTRGDSSYHKVHVSHHLSTCTHVFVRHNAI